jgi:ABC-2 type transport system permease protein
MKNVWNIAKREFLAYFTSPMAYILTATFLLITGYMFYQIMASFIQYSLQYQQFNVGKSVTLTDAVIQPLFGSMNTVLLFIFPMITMRLIAEERKNETLPLILTAPIRLIEFILGKFLASLMLVSVMLGLTLVYPIILTVFGNPEWGPILGAYLGSLFMISCYLAIGLVFSATTDNQIIAGSLTFAASLFFWIINWASQSVGSTWGEVLNYLSLINHYQPFARGLIVSSDLIFFVSFISVGLYLAHQVLDSYRWR